jgi:hypothetical protein
LTLVWVGLVRSPILAIAATLTDTVTAAATNGTATVKTADGTEHQGTGERRKAGAQVDCEIKEGKTAWKATQEGAGLEAGRSYGVRLWGLSREGESTMAAFARPRPQAPTGRSADSAWRANCPVNVGDLERWLSLLGGGLLALTTVRRSLGTLVLLGGAGALLYRGLTGHCALYQTMGLSTVSPDAAPDSSHSVADPDEPPLIVVAGS